MLIICKLIHNNGGDINIRMLDIPGPILTGPEPRHFDFPSEYLRVLPIAAVLECVLDIVDDLVSESEVGLGHTLLLVYHPD